MMCKWLGFFVFVTFPFGCSSKENWYTNFQGAKLSIFFWGEGKLGPLAVLNEALVAVSGRKCRVVSIAY